MVNSKRSKKARSKLIIVWIVVVILAVSSVLALTVSFLKTLSRDSEDLKCVPASCCHATSCVPAGQAPDCSGVACTQECRPGTLDCGQGVCEAVNGECKVKWAN